MLSFHPLLDLLAESCELREGTFKVMLVGHMATLFTVVNATRKVWCLCHDP